VFNATSPCTPTSSTIKTGHHDIAEILLKVALNTKNQSINQFLVFSNNVEKHAVLAIGFV
jgi:hypothetical protein